MNSLATKIKVQWCTNMGDWSQQLLELDFQKETKEDGSTSYTLITGHRRDYYWTKITVKQVGSPTPDAWQVTCARSEIRIGLWKIHNTTQDISVVVHTSAQKMIEDINYQTSLKPSFLSKISNWSHSDSWFTKENSMITWLSAWQNHWRIRISPYGLG